MSTDMSLICVLLVGTQRRICKFSALVLALVYYY